MLTKELIQALINECPLKPEGMGTSEFNHLVQLTKECRKQLIFVEQYDPNGMNYGMVVIRLLKDRWLFAETTARFPVFLFKFEELKNPEQFRGRLMNEQNYSSENANYVWEYLKRFKDEQNL